MNDNDDIQNNIDRLSDVPRKKIIKQFQEDVKTKMFEEKYGEEVDKRVVEELKKQKKIIWTDGLNKSYTIDQIKNNHLLNIIKVLTEISPDKYLLKFLLIEKENRKL